ncbi:MAG: hypothetical protein IJA54_06765 [Tyzzerella sp.]|nr:hypothetical protein [Tyzzerella sp.]
MIGEQSNMNIFFKKILSGILKTINDISSATIFLFIELFLWIANINIKIGLLYILIGVLYALLMYLIVLLELPLILIGLGLEKILSKNIDISKPVQTSKAQYNVHEESCIPFKQSAKKTEKVVLKTQLTEREKVQIQRSIIKNNRKSLGMPHSSSDINLTWYLNQYMSLNSYISQNEGWIIADGILIGREN